ncbi:kinase-like domain-containing protein [Pilobolus umbonatus]|nr:kinase-like domain-containing protein [Pilobolus umbonatus]
MKKLMHVVKSRLKSLKPKKKDTCNTDRGEEEEVREEGSSIFQSGGIDSSEQDIIERATVENPIVQDEQDSAQVQQKKPIKRHEHKLTTILGIKVIQPTINEQAYLDQQLAQEHGNMNQQNHIRKGPMDNANQKNNMNPRYYSGQKHEVEEPSNMAEASRNNMAQPNNTLQGRGVNMVQQNNMAQPNNMAQANRINMNQQRNTAQANQHNMNQQNNMAQRRGINVAQQNNRRQTNYNNMTQPNNMTQGYPVNMNQQNYMEQGTGAAMNSPNNNQQGRNQFVNNQQAYFNHRVPHTNNQQPYDNYRYQYTNDQQPYDNYRYQYTNNQQVYYQENTPIHYRQPTQYRNENQYVNGGGTYVDGNPFNPVGQPQNSNGRLTIDIEKGYSHRITSPPMARPLPVQNHHMNDDYRKQEEFVRQALGYLPPNTKIMRKPVNYSYFESYELAPPNGMPSLNTLENEYYETIELETRDDETNDQSLLSKMKLVKQGDVGKGKVHLCNPFEFVSLKRFLGEGLSGKVYLVEYRRKSRPYKFNLYAMKMMKLRDNFETMTTAREIRYNFMFDHKNIVRLHQVFFFNNAYHMLMEHMDFDAHLLSERLHGLSIETTSIIIHEVSVAMEYMFNVFGMLHRDIKGVNILVNHHGDVKLADFGLSENMKYAVLERCGTLGYMAPEVDRAGKHHPESDIYSLGITLLELITAKYPDHINFPKGKKDYCQLFAHEEYRDVYYLLVNMLDKEPHYRPSYYTIRKTLLPVIDQCNSMHGWIASEVAKVYYNVVNNKFHDQEHSINI